MANLNLRFLMWLLFLVAPLVIASPCAQAANTAKTTKHAKTVAAKSTKANIQPAKQKVAATAAAPARAPAAFDPNRAVEVRGQSRTLSMMLVLKNGKENINFIKVRKDYRPEIAGTQY